MEKKTNKKQLHEMDHMTLTVHKSKSDNSDPNNLNLEVFRDQQGSDLVAA